MAKAKGYDPILTEKAWTETARKFLLGKKIVSVRYMTDEEQAELQWDHKTIVLGMDDGSIWYPSSDDEGNGAGALLGNIGDESLGLPVI
jgi:hypothetical protein